MRWSRLAALGAAAAVVALAAPATAGAQGSFVGGGQAGGSVTFAPPGVPAVGSPLCGQTSFNLTGESKQTFVINTIIKGYVGPVTLTGTGGSLCETASAGSGDLLLTATGRGPTGSRVDCVGLSGTYNRIGTNVTAQLGGRCEVNSMPGMPVTFIFQGEFVPNGATSGADWVHHNITKADWNGAFTVLPG